MEPSALFVVHLVVIGNGETHLSPLRQVGGLIEDEAPVVDVGFERLHRFEVYVSVASLATGLPRPDLFVALRAAALSKTSRHGSPGTNFCPLYVE
jgi:hypothetical protein